MLISVTFHKIICNYLRNSRETRKITTFDVLTRQHFLSEIFRDCDDHHNPSSRKHTRGLEKIHTHTDRGKTNTFLVSLRTKITGIKRW
jgi:hypothetical protein